MQPAELVECEVGQVDGQIGDVVLDVLFRDEPLGLVEVDVEPLGHARFADTAQRRQHDPYRVLGLADQRALRRALVGRRFELDMHAVDDLFQLGDLGGLQRAVALVVHVVCRADDLLDLDQVYRVALAHPERIIQAKRYGATQGSGQPEVETFDALSRPYEACHLRPQAFLLLRRSVHPVSVRQASLPALHQSLLASLAQ